MVQGLDYSYGRPIPADLYALGYRFVCRYLPYPGADDKVITAPELARLRVAGLAVVFNLERTETRPLGGTALGVLDAQTAQDSLDALGAGDAPVYFSIDFDAQPSQAAAILAYFRGVRSVLPLERIGVYGGDRVWATLRDAQLAAYFWQANARAWSAQYPSPEAHIVQSLPTYVAGVAVDPDTAQQDDYGQWPRPEVDVPLTPQDIAAVVEAVHNDAVGIMRSPEQAQHIESAVLAVLGSAAGQAAIRAAAGGATPGGTVKVAGTLQVQP